MNSYFIRTFKDNLLFQAKFTEMGNKIKIEKKALSSNSCAHKVGICPQNGSTSHPSKTVSSIIIYYGDIDGTLHCPSEGKKLLTSLEMSCRFLLKILFSGVVSFKASFLPKLRKHGMLFMV